MATLEGHVNPTPDTPESQAVADYAAPANPLDLPAETFRAGLSRRRENRAALMGWIREALVEGTDFGRLHVIGKSRCPFATQGRTPECKDPAHWSKPSLWKPGAEKICGMLGVTVAFPTLSDYEQAALRGADLRHAVIRCVILDGAGRPVADGIGARSLAQDGGDLNKALKMAEKSAHIDATLRLAGLSEVFTQDFEDVKPEPDAPEVRPTLGAADCQRLDAAIEDYRLDPERVKAWVRKACKVESVADLSPAQCEKLMAKLGQWAGEQRAAERYAEEQAADAATDICPL